MATYIIRFTVTWDKIDEALGNSLSEKVIFETGFAKNIVPDGRNYDKQIDTESERFVWEWRTRSADAL